MRKLFTVIFTFIAIASFSQGFELVNASFDTLNPVQKGQQVWVDYKLVYGGYTSSTKSRIFIVYDNDPSNPIEIYNQNYYSVVMPLPQNPDGSRRINVTLPSNPSSNNFYLTTLGLKKMYGKFATVSGVDDPDYSDDTPVEYYNLSGIRVNNPSNGVFIMVKGATRRTVYLNSLE